MCKRSVDVHRLDRSIIMKFVEHASGLYVFDSAVRKRSTSQNVSAYNMVSTEADQKKLISR